MEELKFKSTGTDSMYLANTNILFTTVFGLTVFKEGWREDKLGSQSALQNAQDWFRQMFEGGLTGNRIHIAARKEARKDLNGTIQKILHYIAIFADESDIQVLLRSGVVTKKTPVRGRRTVRQVPAAA